MFGILKKMKEKKKEVKFIIRKNNYVARKAKGGSASTRKNGQYLSFDLYTTQGWSLYCRTTDSTFPLYILYYITMTRHIKWNIKDFMYKTTDRSLYEKKNVVWWIENLFLDYK